MDHWRPPDERGVYDHPHAHPPIPQSRHTNDHGSRLARLEEWATHSAHHRYRIEEESRRRGMDNAAAIVALAARITALETWRATITERLDTLRTLSSWLVASLRFMAAAVLIALLISGRLTPEQLKAAAGLLGLPGG